MLRHTVFNKKNQVYYLFCNKYLFFINYFFMNEFASEFFIVYTIQCFLLICLVLTIIYFFAIYSNFKYLIKFVTLMLFKVNDLQRLV